MILQDDNFNHLLGYQVTPGVVCIVLYEYSNRLTALPLELHTRELPLIAETGVYHEHGVHMDRSQ